MQSLPVLNSNSSIGDRQLNRQRGQPTLNQTTRQRITGSLVLAVAALILLPVIFDGEGSYLPTVEPRIPERPTHPQPAFQDAQRPVIEADSDAIRIRPESAEALITEDEPEQPVADAEPVSAPTPPPQVAATQPAPVTPAPAPTAAASTNRTAALDVQGLPESWSVRLASFSNTANASALVTRLQEAGHRAYTRRVESSQGVLTAVFVGPLVDRGAAQILLDRLRQDFQLSGMIVRYEIEQL